MCTWHVFGIPIFPFSHFFPLSICRKMSHSGSRFVRLHWGLSVVSLAAIDAVWSSAMWTTPTCHVKCWRRSGFTSGLDSRVWGCLGAVWWSRPSWNCSRAWPACASSTSTASTVSSCQELSWAERSIDSRSELQASVINHLEHSWLFGYSFKMSFVICMMCRYCIWLWKINQEMNDRRYHSLHLNINH